jgi:hypothetical protein
MHVAERSLFLGMSRLLWAFGKIYDKYTVGHWTFANSLAVCLTPPP